ncbi:MAG: cytochrome c3 family protein [Planctomycetes bacterium]|nr:cytochrome c3 family protein [Planctomycetota bacterium]
MSKKTHTIILAVALLNLAIVAFVGYAVEWDQSPVGFLFLTKGGPVAFNHQLHAPPGTPEKDCKECHHDLPNGSPPPQMSCRACHYYGKEPKRCEAEKIHKRCIGAKCRSCHVIEDCSHCHKQTH